MVEIYNRNIEHIPWVCNQKEEDFFATIEQYKLRVEKMDVNRYWWSVSYLGYPIVHRIPSIVDSKERAIGLAEGIYEAHSIFSKSTPILKFFQSKIN